MASIGSYATGQQETKVESLESIHAARLRSGSEAGTSAPQREQPTAAVVGKSQTASDDDEAEDEADIPINGLGEPDTELDPYNLPVSHEVALEGMSSPATPFCHPMCPCNCIYDQRDC